MITPLKGQTRTSVDKIRRRVFMFRKRSQFSHRLIVIIYCHRVQNLFFFLFTGVFWFIKIIEKVPYATLMSYVLCTFSSIRSKHRKQRECFHSEAQLKFRKKIDAYTFICMSIDKSQ